MNLPLSIRFLLAAAGLVLAASGATAQSFDSVTLQGDPESSGSGRVGGVLISAPRYLGSDEQRTLLLPFIDYRWKNGFFAGLGNGIGYKFPSSPQLQYGVRLSVDFGRKEKRSPVLTGMGDIDASPEAGAFFNYLITHEWSLKSSLRYGAGNDHDGLLFDLGLHYATQLAPQWRLGLGVDATYANASYMQDYFGVTPAQSAATGYAVSNVGAGVRDVRGSVTLMLFINRNWIASAVLTVASLQGDAKNSVIVRERTPVTGVLGLSYGF